MWPPPNAGRRSRGLAVGVILPTVCAAITSGVAHAAQQNDTAAPPTTVAASADTYVVAQAANNAYGSESRLTAANWSTWTSETYLRFTVPALSAGSTISSVRLELAFQRADRQPGRVELHELSGSWSETTTYATRPTVGAMVDTVTMSQEGRTTLSFDVSDSVDGAGEHAFAITNPTANSVAAMFSREHGADGPRLIIDYGTDDDSGGSPAPRAGTLCGASFGQEGQTWQQALQREDQRFNGLEMVRIFYSGLPQDWPGKLDTAKRPINVSFKAPEAEVIAGRHDTRLRNWFRNAPRDQDVYWTFHHEPENDAATSKDEAAKAQYRDVWKHLTRLADEADNPRLRATLVLMGWTLEPGSNRNWRDWYAGKQFIDVLGWDPYNPGWKSVEDPGYRTPEQIFGPVVRVSAQEGLPFAISETGSPLVTGDSGGRQRAQWLRDIASYLTDNNALFVAYFHLDWSQPGKPLDYRLLDQPSQQAWREFCS